MSFFSNPFKNLIHNPLKFVQNSLPTIGAIIGSAVPGVGTAAGAALGAAAGGAAKGALEGQGLGGSLREGAFSGAGAYAGNVIGDTLGSQLGGTLGRTVGDVGVSNIPTSALGSYALNAIPASLANSSIGSILGGAAGMSAADNVMQSDRAGMPNIPNPAATGTSPFMPKQENEQQTPASLSALGSLTDTQKSSNLATQGVYGGGNGAEEQKYFTNLLNRRLVDSGGNVSDMSGVSPIEQSYLQKLGLSGYGNSKDLLEAISKWKPA